MIGAMPFIAMAANVSRVVQGVKIQHVIGDPKLPRDADEALRLRVVNTALEALQTEVTGPTLFEPPELEEASRIAESAGV